MHQLYIPLANTTMLNPRKILKVVEAYLYNQQQSVGVKLHIFLVGELSLLVDQLKGVGKNTLTLNKEVSKTNIGVHNRA